MKKILLSILQWVVAGFFIICALGNGFHWSSIILLIAAFLMMPIPVVRNFFENLKIKSWVLAVVSVVLLFVGIGNSPASDVSDNGINENNGASYSDTAAPETFIAEENTPENVSAEINTPLPTDAITNNPVPCTPTPCDPPTSTPAPTPTLTPSVAPTTAPTPTPTNPPAQEEMVWIPTHGGACFHSKSTCSKMIDPICVSKDEAIKRGFKSCGICYR